MFCFASTAEGFEKFCTLYGDFAIGISFFKFIPKTISNSTNPSFRNLDRGKRVEVFAVPLLTYHIPQILNNHEFYHGVSNRYV